MTFLTSLFFPPGLLKMTTAHDLMLDGGTTAWWDLTVTRAPYLTAAVGRELCASKTKSHCRRMRSIHHDTTRQPQGFVTWPVDVEKRIIRLRQRRRGQRADLCPRITLRSLLQAQTVLVFMACRLSVVINRCLPCTSIYLSCQRHFMWCLQIQ